MEFTLPVSTEKAGLSLQIASILRFDSKGLVCLHQDYWNSTAGTVELVPVLGWLISKIKALL